jgi:hypothetical protein
MATSFSIRNRVSPLPQIATYVCLRTDARARSAQTGDLHDCRFQRRAHDMNFKVTNIREFIDTQALARASQMDAPGLA